MNQYANPFHIRSNTIPVGADAHIKYRSKHSFGAVLVTQKPITLTSFNDEILFESWLDSNKALLSLSYGSQLRRHGLVIVTRTYTAPCCSINAWEDRKNEASMSVKLKANMMGELGDTLDWTDRLTDQDWSHYSGKGEGDTVVVFFDGIEVPAWDWWLEGVRTSVGRGIAAKETSASDSSNIRSAARPHNMIRAHNDSATGDSLDESDLLSEDLWGSDTRLRTYSSISSRSSSSHGRQRQSEEAGSPRNVSTPTRLSKHLAYDEKPTPRTQQRPKASPIANHRLSVISTTTSDSSASSKTQSREIISYETSPSTSIRRKSELRRKTGSPSLRSTT